MSYEMISIRDVARTNVVKAIEQNGYDCLV